MKSARKKIVRYLLVFATLAFVCLMSGIIPINASLFRVPIENAIRDATGLTISIGDSIMVRFGVSPTVKTGTLSLGGSTDDALLTVESLSATVELFPLLADRISIKQLIVTGVGVDYCSSIPKRPQKAGEGSTTMSVAIDQVDRCGCRTRVEADAWIAGRDAGERHFNCFVTLNQ